jgi:tRNA(fMet)-specific endonuclease VapC
MSNDARLLDSSVVIRHFRQGGEVSTRLETFSALYLPSVALGELHSGALRSARPAKNLAQIEAFTAGVTIITIDDETAKHYGQISAQLAAAGQPIPHNDMWIAACAMQWNLTVATTDAHYSRIQGLNCELW